MKQNSFKDHKIDYTGYRNVRLLVVEKANTGRNQWICKCDCGTTKIMTPSRFKTFKSCGCLEKENKKNLQLLTRKHGMTNSILYSKYCGMKLRCYNRKYKYFDRYGGRGISVCDEWLGEHGFENFCKWAYENGYDESKTTYQQTIDRIDTNGNYEPSNCRWANQTEQVRNRSISKYIIHNGKNIPMAEFAEKYNITKSWFITRRLSAGYSSDDIIKEWDLLNNCKDEYMTKKEASLYFNVSLATIDNWIKNNKLQSVKLKGAVLIKKKL